MGELIIATDIIGHAYISDSILQRILLQKNKLPNTKHVSFTLQIILVQVNKLLIQIT